MASADTSGVVVADRTGDEWMALAAAFELTALGLTPVCPELGDICASGEYEDACAEVFAACGFDNVDPTPLAECRGANADDTFHSLRRERTRLFVGERTPLITPYIGVWAAQSRGQKGQLMIGSESMAIERFMHGRGVAKNLAAGQGNDPMDHIGTVCEFLQFLCLANARAVQAADGRTVNDGDFDLFRGTYFADYARWCADRLDEEARLPFYKVKAAQLRALAHMGN